MKLSKWETSLFFTMLLLKHNECIYDYIEERGQNFLKIYLRNIWMSPKIFWSVTPELFWLEDQTIWVLVPMLSETSDLAPGKYLLCSQNSALLVDLYVLKCQGLLLKIFLNFWTKVKSFKVEIAFSRETALIYGISCLLEK